MKILVIGGEFDKKSGYGTYAYTLVEALKMNGHEVVTMGKKQQDCMYPMLIDHLKLLSNPFRILSEGIKMRKVINKEKPDYVHCTVELYSHCLLLSPKKYQKKSIVVLHGTYAVQQFLYPVQRWISALLVKRCAAFIAVSNFTKNQVTQTILKYVSAQCANMFAQKTHVIHNAIILPKTRLNMLKNEKLIIHVGGIKERKGVLELVKSFDHLLQSIPDAHLYIIGKTYDQSAYYEKVKKYIEQGNVSEHITITGIVSDELLHSYYERASVFVLPAITNWNYFEGFGLVFLEANAYGIPCIGPNDSGAVEAICEGVSGYSIDPKNYTAIAEACKKILDGKTIKSADCVEWAKKHSLEVFSQKLHTVYTTL